MSFLTIWAFFKQIVFTATNKELQWNIEKKEEVADAPEGDSVVKLRGLPFECSRDDIAKFFNGN